MSLHGYRKKILMIYLSCGMNFDGNRNVKFLRKAREYLNERDLLDDK
jgi:hypothetical protein